MLLAIFGLALLTLSLCMFFTAMGDNLNLSLPVILFFLGVGASIGDPSLLAPVGRFIISQVWLGGA